MALQKGHADAIRAFGELLKLVPPKQRVKLLSVECFAGSALAAALQKGNLEALEQYMEIVKNTAPDLNAKERTALLSYIRNSHGHRSLGVWKNDPPYKDLKANNPAFYRRFKEMKSALKA